VGDARLGVADEEGGSVTHKREGQEGDEGDEREFGHGVVSLVKRVGRLSSHPLFVCCL